MQKLYFSLFSKCAFINTSMIFHVESSLPKLSAHLTSSNVANMAIMWKSELPC